MLCTRCEGWPVHWSDSKDMHAEGYHHQAFCSCVIFQSDKIIYVHDPVKPENKWRKEKEPRKPT